MFVFDIAQLAQKSLIYEASVYPKPGLVTPLSQGAHRDMDYRTFVDSAIALLPCFINCASVGFETHSLSCSDVLPMLRETGKHGEKEMYAATRGVNTHKGAVFLLGLLCAAAGRLKAEDRPLLPEQVAGVAADFVDGIVDRELARKTPHPSPTAGERAYALYGVDGARGEAERGFPTAMAALQTLQDPKYCTLPLRERWAHVLIGIMANNSDSNLVARGGLQGMFAVQEYARKAMSAGGMLTIEGRRRIEEMERVFVERNLSPGGCADILAAALFLQGLVTVSHATSDEW